MIRYPGQLIFFLFLICFWIHQPILAQEKFEKESRLKPSEVPGNALDFMNTLDLGVKIKWYWEEGLDRTSVEAKFKQRRKSFSVEFDTLGQIEDVEVEVGSKEIPKAVSDAIAIRLKEDCQRYRLEKIQIQYIGRDDLLGELIQFSETADELLINYELVVRCQNEQGVNLYEYLFDSNGKVLSMAKIIFKNSSHLEY
jgi:hypothetical protein